MGYLGRCPIFFTTLCMKIFVIHETFLLHTYFPITNFHIFLHTPVNFITLRTVVKLSVEHIHRAMHPVLYKGLLHRSNFGPTPQAPLEYHKLYFKWIYVYIEKSRWIGIVALHEYCHVGHLCNASCAPLFLSAILLQRERREWCLWVLCIWSSMDIHG